MAKVVIVGGKLQGCEAAYLGKEAGMEIILIDTDPNAPAQKMCSEFICGDVLSDDPKIVKVLGEADMILPTMENEKVLKGLTLLARANGYKLAFDLESYNISSSKKISDKLFSTNDLPCPRYYPDGNYPYIAKPESESGSHGVCILNCEEELESFLKSCDKKYIIQEFVTGPSYSVEIIGTPGNYRTYEITEIFVDDIYDCNMAATHHTLDDDKKKRICDLAVSIAELIRLKGIMDLEVIDNGEDMIILEIDARFPSQTPIVVYHASGMNYMEELYDLFTTGNFNTPQINHGRCASLTHYFYDGNKYVSQGEHIMVEGGILNFDYNLCSEAVVITDIEESGKEWRGTFINWADSLDELKEKEALMDSELLKMSKMSKENVNENLFDSAEAKVS